MRLIDFEGIGIGSFEGGRDPGAPFALCVAGVDQHCMIWGGENIPAVLCKRERLQCLFR